MTLEAEPINRVQLPPIVDSTRTHPPPTADTGTLRRLAAVDATRGVALLGMIAVHSLYESDPSGRPSLSFAIFGGRAAAAFAVLAGVGLTFMTGRRRVRFRGGLQTVVALGM